MAKHPSYLGGHSQSGTSVGFAGWGAKKGTKAAGVGLVGMAPAIDEAGRFTLLKPENVSASMFGKQLRKKKNANRT